MCLSCVMLLAVRADSFFLPFSPTHHVCFKSMHHCPTTCISTGPVVSLSEWHLCGPAEPSGCVPHTCERNRPGFGSDSHQTASLPTHTLTHALTHKHQIQTAQIEQFPEANIWHLTNSGVTERLIQKFQQQMLHGWDFPITTNSLKQLYTKLWTAILKAQKTVTSPSVMSVLVECAILKRVCTYACMSKCGAAPKWMQMGV